MVVPQGQRGFTGSAQTGRSFPKRSFVRPSWMDEDTVESAAMSESVFFSKVSSRTSRLQLVSLSSLRLRVLSVQSISNTPEYTHVIADGQPRDKHA